MVKANPWLLSYDLCKRLKAAGYPQDQFPQLIYLGGNPTKGYGTWLYQTVEFIDEPERPPLESIACPVFMGASGEGVGLWLHQRGIMWDVVIGEAMLDPTKRTVIRWWMLPSVEFPDPPESEYPTVEALVSAALDMLGVPNG